MAQVIWSPVATVRDAANACQSVICVPAVDAEYSAKWVRVAPLDAAADVSAVLFAFTLGVAAVAAAHPVAPIAVRAIAPDSEVPFAEYAMWVVAPDVGNSASKMDCCFAWVKPAMTYVSLSMMVMCFVTCHVFPAEVVMVQVTPTRVGEPVVDTVPPERRNVTCRPSPSMVSASFVSPGSTSTVAVVMVSPSASQSSHSNVHDPTS